MENLKRLDMKTKAVYREEEHEIVELNRSALLKIIPIKKSYLLVGIIPGPKMIGQTFCSVCDCLFDFRNAPVVMVGNSEVLVAHACSNCSAITVFNIGLEARSRIIEEIDVSEELIQQEFFSEEKQSIQ